MSVKIDGYEIDAFLTEEHAFNSEVSSHPVEKGSDVTDHVRPLPITVSVEGLVSDSPIGAIASRRGDVDSNGQLLILPSNDAYAFMLEIRNKREPVTIETSLKQFENMALQTLTVPRDSRTGKALRFRATFIQLQLVVNERTSIRVSIPRAAKKQNVGNKAVLGPGMELYTPPPEKINETKESWAIKAGGGDLLNLLGI